MVRVELAESVVDAMLAIGSKADAVAVARRLRALETFPELGTVYDPAYEAARPEHDVLVTFAGHYGIYYTYADDCVSVEYLQDERRDPRTRFKEPTES